MSKSDLRKKAEIAPNTMTKLRRDEEVSLTILSVADLKQDAIQLFKEKAVKRGRLTKEEVSVEDAILIEFEFDSRTSFRRKYLTPMLECGVLKMTMPEKPSSKKQKFFS